MHTLPGTVLTVPGTVYVCPAKMTFRNRLHLLVSEKSKLARIDEKHNPPAVGVL